MLCPTPLIVKTKTELPTPVKNLILQNYGQHAD